MARSTLKVIDGAALRKELKKRNLSFTETSRNLGYSANIITTGIRKNKLSTAVIQGLKIGYNIFPETYVIERTTSGNIIDEETNSSNKVFVDYSKLQNIIYEAVYSAMHKALSE